MDRIVKKKSLTKSLTGMFDSEYNESTISEIDILLSHNKYDTQCLTRCISILLRLLIKKDTFSADCKPENKCYKIFFDSDYLNNLSSLFKYFEKKTISANPIKIVIILTENYFKSIWCLLELYTIFNKSTNIIIVMPEYTTNFIKYLKKLQKYLKTNIRKLYNINGLNIDSNKKRVVQVYLDLNVVTNVVSKSYTGNITLNDLEKKTNKIIEFALDRLFKLLSDFDYQNNDEFSSSSNFSYKNNENYNINDYNNEPISRNITIIRLQNIQNIEELSYDENDIIRLNNIIYKYLIKSEPIDLDPIELDLNPSQEQEPNPINDYNLLFENDEKSLNDELFNSYETLLLNSDIKESFIIYILVNNNDYEAVSMALIIKTIAQNSKWKSKLNIEFNILDKENYVKDQLFKNNQSYLPLILVILGKKIDKDFLNFLINVNKKFNHELAEHTNTLLKYLGISIGDTFKTKTINEWFEFFEEKKINNNKDIKFLFKIVSETIFLTFNVNVHILYLKYQLLQIIYKLYSNNIIKKNGNKIQYNNVIKDSIFRSVASRHIESI
jgi:hypothetical protein